MESHCVAQTGLEFLASSDPPAMISQSAGITGTSHCTEQSNVFLNLGTLRLEHSSTISAHRNLHHPGSSNPPNSAS
ncbi:hypothetical protein AAY473_002629 [Plecturocebus cupreus]